MISYGIDIGTTTLRATACEIVVGPFSRRDVRLLGDSLCVFTPFLNAKLDCEKILALIDEWSGKNNLPKPDLGTCLITGEAQRAENAEEVGARVSQRWEGLLTSQLDPELETKLAAYGSGAVLLSERNVGKPVLHMDIGGGTSNLAWIVNGVIEDMACLDLGSRKWILDPTGRVLSSTTAGNEIFPNVMQFDEESARETSEKIADLILKAQEFVIVPWKHPKTSTPILSVSGGVVDCMKSPPKNRFAFGDLGPFLGEALKQKANLHLSSGEGRATVLGIATHSFQMSGISIHETFESDVKNLPLYFEEELKGFPDRFAVELSDLKAEVWAKRLKHSNVSEVIFLMKENLGKTFGYRLSKVLGTSDIRFKVLDEIPSIRSSNTLPVRTVDIRKIGDRYSVIVKELRRF